MEKMATVWISIVLLSLIGSAFCGLDLSICSIFEKSYGLIPPPLPKNFEIKAEHVDHNQNYVSYQELYFDYTNLRAKYKYLLDSLEYHYLFDYGLFQVVEWIKVHPGTSMRSDPLSQLCEAKDILSTPLTSIFGYDDWTSEHPKMFNSYQVLRFGGQYLYASNGSLKLDERGMNVNKFVGCLFDSSINGTLFNDYYFADTETVMPSGATPSSVVNGFDKRPLSVPVTLHLTGASFQENDRKDINETYSISWFKGNPKFQDETFQVPPWVYCEDYEGRKVVPIFPRAFSTSLVTTEFVLDVLGQRLPKDELQVHEEIYYDAEKKLARRDFTPSQYTNGDIISLFGSNTSVRSVYDFNEGILFMINKQSGKCIIDYIPDNDMFDTEEQVADRRLATPEELFVLEEMENMEYKGKATVRDIKCDVFNGRHNSIRYGAKLDRELYFSTDGWHEIAEGIVEYRVPVRNVIMRREINGDVAEGVSTYDFLKFKNKAPFLSSYDIKNCVDLIEHKRFALVLSSGNDFDLIFKYKYLFLEAAQLHLSKISGVNTPLRVQRLHLRNETLSGNQEVFLVFTLLGKAPVRRTIPMAQKGEELPNAIILLQKAVNFGNFSINLMDPQTQKDISVSVQRGSLYYLSSGGKLQEKLSKDLRDDSETVVVTEVEEYEEHEGMTGGHLTLLAFAMIFIGLGIGIAVMYLYIRVYSERRLEDRIRMDESLGSSNVEGALGETNHDPL